MRILFWISIFNKIKLQIWRWKKNREYEKKIKELKKRDPFTYKNF